MTVRKSFSALLVAALLSSCASEEALREDAVMDFVERTITMPAGAHSLSSYARYYAPASTDIVEAEYVRSEPRETGANVGCSEVTLDLTLRPTPCETPMPSDEIRTGLRQWRHSARDLPLYMDGGCDVLHILYSLRQHAFIMVRCSGAG